LPNITPKLGNTQAKKNQPSTKSIRAPQLVLYIRFLALTLL
jgi:hypothetical protein